MRFIPLFAGLLSFFSLAAGVIEKVEKVIPLNKDLIMISADGNLEDSAVYTRNSAAKTPDGKSYRFHQPRFWKNAMLFETEKRAVKQAGDRLSYAIIQPQFGQKGAIACNVEVFAELYPQTLLTIGGGDWKNPFEVTLNRTKSGTETLTAQLHGKKASAVTSLGKGKRQHLIVSWDDQNLTLYLNGRKEAFCKSANQLFEQKHVLYIGSRKIRLGSNAIFSNVVLFKEPLTEKEAEALAASPDLRSHIKMKKIVKQSRFSAFPVNTGVVTVRFSSSVPCKKVSAKIGNYEIVRTAIIGKDQINCTFDPALLMPGKYQLKLDCTLADGSRESCLSSVEICKALRPKENLQVNTWGESAKTHPDYGVTMYATRTSAAAIDEAARLGVYGTFNYHYAGTPRKDHPEDFAHGVNGENLFPNPRSPYIQQDVLQSAKEMMALVKDSPVFMGVVVNSERPTGGSGYKCFDFSPAELQRAKSFGLDLARWQKVKKMSILPMGNLRASVAPELCPENGVIPENNPLYAYHVDRHSSKGGTEVVINDLIAKEILSQRPDMMAIQDPMMRRAFLRSYRDVNIAADWCYYENLYAVVSLTERLFAAARGNPNMSVSCMPQFLFKRGTAAPYAGLPPADMFREACLLSVSRPTRVVTFWNAKAALCPPEKDPRNARYAWDAGETPEAIAKVFGNKSWEECAAIVKERKGKVFCLDPKVRDTFKELSDTIWQPFGALFPKWQNAPRRMALVRSFASDLFSNVEWPGYRMPLLAETFKVGVPCDVLYDEDLSKDLSQYDLIVLPQISALPEKGVENLLAFQKQGGVIVADDMLKVKALSGAVILKKKSGTDQDFAKRAEELLQQCGGNKNSIGYIEGIQILQEQAAANTGFPELRELVFKHVKTAFRTKNQSLFWNHLQASGADYLFVVNDLRVPGPIYGRFGKVRETGVAQKVTFEVRDPAFRYAYDLTGRKLLPVNGGKLELELGPCSGRIILFTKEKIGRLQVKSPDVLQGGQADVSVILEHGTGLIPVQLELFDPNGKKLSLSCSDVVKNGSLKHVWTIPLNAPCGSWKVRVRELAQGQQAETLFQVKAR